MKSGEEAVYFLLDRMNEIGVDYMIVGSFSSNAYGVARATKDADFVVLSGDPLSVYTHVLETWVEGKKVFDRADPKDYLIAVGGKGAGDADFATHDLDCFDGDIGGNE